MNVDKIAAFSEPIGEKLFQNRKARRRSAALMRRAETIERKVKPYFRKGDKAKVADARAAYRAFKAGAITMAQAQACGCSFVRGVLA